MSTVGARGINGIITPLITPLSDRDVLDVQGLQRLIDHVLNAGVSGIFILGTSGEAPSLSYQLRREMIRRSIEFVGSRAPVFVGVTDTSFVESIHLAEYASSCGADAAVLTMPYYFPAGQTELRHYLRNIIPKIPNKNKFKINVIKTEMPGIVTSKKTIQINKRINNWQLVLNKYKLCHLAVIERHGKTKDYAHGFIQNFNLKSGAVASSVGHDAHNIIVAGINEADMKLAVDEIKSSQGAIVVIDQGKIKAKLELPISGLLSDKRATKVAVENKKLKKIWSDMGCTLPYMGFNLLPLSVIPNFRLTNRGLVDVNSMNIVPLFE